MPLHAVGKPSAAPQLLLLAVVAGLPGWVGCVENGGPVEPQEHGQEMEATIRAMRLPRAGQQVKAILSPGEIHEYRLSLPSGHAVVVEVDQMGTDLAIDIESLPSGEEFEVDSPIGGAGPEKACWSASSDSHLKVGVRPYAKLTEPRPYALTFSGVRETSEQDRRCLSAMREMAELESLRREHPFAAGLISHYQRLAEELQSIDQPFQAAVALKGLAALYRQAERLHEEADCFREALALFREAGHSVQQVITLNHLGLSQIDLGKPADSGEAFRAALELASTVGYEEGIGAALLNLGYLKRRLGQWHEALEHYERAFDRIPVTPTLERATLLNNIAACLIRLQRYSPALDRLQEARAMLSLPEIRSQPDAPAALATVLGHIGRLQSFRRLNQDALQTLNEALEATKAPRERARVLERIAEVYGADRSFEEAHEAYRRAWALQLGAGALHETIDVRVGLAEIFRESSRPVEAVRLLRGLQEDAQLSQSLRQFHEPGITATANTVWAKAERDLGNLEAAVEKAAEASESIKLLRSAARSQGDQLQPFRPWQDALELQVGLLLDMGRREPDGVWRKLAFETGDAGRGRLFYESLLESQYNPRGSADAPLLKREKELQGKVIALERRRSRLLEADNRAALEDVEKQLEEIRLDYDRTLRQIRQRNPYLSRLRDPSRASLEQIQAQLHAGTLLARYFLGEESSVLFLVGPSLIEAYRLPPRAEIEGLARGLHEAWSDHRKLRAAGGVSQQKAFDLAEMLLAPLRPHLPLQRLVIVADGALHYLPFAALPIEPASPAATGQRLIDLVEIAHLPLAGALPALRHRREQRTSRPPGLLALLAPTFEADGSESLAEDRRGATPALADSAPPLPQAQREADEIHAIYLSARPGSPENVRLFKGPAACRPLLMTPPGLSGYKILHLATHVVIEGDRSDAYRILLSRSGQAQGELGHAVYLPEIYGLNLPAELVVLSGCQTALGAEVLGEGLVGWTQGFFYAGASRLIVSLWDVQDQPTAELMVAFHRGLFRQGLGPAEALRRAQLEIRRQPRWSHPNYWAGFVLQGEWQPIAF